MPAFFHFKRRNKARKSASITPIQYSTSDVANTTRLGGNKSFQKSKIHYEKKK